MTDGRSLAAHSHCQSILLGSASEERIDLAGAGMAAGHGGDDDRRCQLVVEEARMQIDLVQVDLGEGLVDEVDVIPAGRDGCRDGPLGGDIDVVGFASGNVVQGFGSHAAQESARCGQYNPPKFGPAVRFPACSGRPQARCRGVSISHSRRVARPGSAHHR